ncbi:MAG TPA: homoserine dehydrogenase, partial [Actinomycetota bacterium]|nr:homoserine dehydrogenase [Actinomycetota bacterium]
AAAFAAQAVSIRSVLQRGKGEKAQLVLVTHLAREGAVRAVLEGLRRLEVVSNLASVMRVEGEEADEVLGW